MKKNRVGLKDLNMNEATYALRRRVINMIYEARELVDGLPRVEVRIVEDSVSSRGNCLLGMASLKAKHISITKASFAFDEERLRWAVYHELVHTLFGVLHFDECPLMRPTHNKKVSKAEVQKLFKKYAKGVQCESKILCS